MVCLSSYGLKCGYNSRFLKDDPYQVGLVLEVSNKSLYPFKILWTVTTQYKGQQSNTHARRELKHAGSK